MGQMQLPLNQVTGDLAQVKDHFGTANAATAVAVAEQGRKMTSEGSDLRKLHDVAEDPTRSIKNVEINATLSGSKRNKQNWHFTRPKDLFPTAFRRRKRVEEMERGENGKRPLKILSKVIPRILMKEKKEINIKLFRDNGLESWEHRQEVYNLVKKYTSNEPCNTGMG